jgi:hypothetical protein
LENIKLIQYKRSQAEIHLIESLQALGLSKQENHLLGLYKNQNKAYACIQWALEHRKIRIIRFSLENLKIDGKKIDNSINIAFSPTHSKRLV